MASIIQTSDSSIRQETPLPDDPAKGILSIIIDPNSYRSFAAERHRIVLSIRRLLSGCLVRKETTATFRSCGGSQPGRIEPAVIRLPFPETRFYIGRRRSGLPTRTGTCQQVNPP